MGCPIPWTACGVVAFGATRRLAWRLGVATGGGLRRQAGEDLFLRPVVATIPPAGGTTRAWVRRRHIAGD